MILFDKPIPMPRRQRLTVPDDEPDIDFGPPCPACHHPHLSYDDETCVSCGCPAEPDPDAPGLVRCAWCGERLTSHEEADKHREEHTT